ncbi:MAG: serine/threonine protein kinase, partial [Akkermansia sp.]|nr:serine/threonine protein kinase [Akkermansia sp.]
MSQAPYSAPFGNSSPLPLPKTHRVSPGMAAAHPLTTQNRNAASMLSRPVGNFMENILAAAREENITLSQIASTDNTAIPAEDEPPCPIAPKELPNGTLLHGYRVQSCIGGGGFGVTYLAQESLLNRTVVIKENFPDSLCYREEGTLDVCMHNPETSQEGFDWALSNFLREVRLLATLNHSCIAKVYAYFEEHRTAYYVVEYINGISLAKLAGQHAASGIPISQSSLFGLMIRLLDALDYLHSRKLLHRDIKPDNILITRAGLPVIIDFGAAREAYGDLGTNIVETPGFSPPEQSSIDGNMGPWTDIYALGATLYYT